MEKIKIFIDKRKLNALIRKHNFHNKYNYQFIGMEFDTDKNNTAKFYESTQVSENSWTNYQGIKLWHNYNENWTKAEVLDRITDDIIMHTQWYMEENHDVQFIFVNF